MVAHLHVYHVGLDTRLECGATWVPPTFPTPRYLHFATGKGLLAFHPGARDLEGQSTSYPNSVLRSWSRGSSESSSRSATSSSDYIGIVPRPPYKQRVIRRQYLRRVTISNSSGDLMHPAFAASSPIPVNGSPTFCSTRLLQGRRFWIFSVSLNWRLSADLSQHISQPQPAAGSFGWCTLAASRMRISRSS